MPQATPSTGITIFALRIAAELVRQTDHTVSTDTHQGLDGETDSVTITTDDYTVTVTPTPSDGTPPPYIGMTHPPM